MGSVFPKLIFSCVVLLAFAAFSAAQTAADNSPMNGRGDREREVPKTFREMLARQRAAKEKKDHEEMLKRGEEALRLSELLETSFEKNGALTRTDREKLEALEKLVTKIRRDLGGDDDDGGVTDTAGDDLHPSTVDQAFGFLKETTLKLVDELKKTTRFSISAVAIQSSNNVLRLVRFLRFRK